MSSGIEATAGRRNLWRHLMSNKSSIRPSRIIDMSESRQPKYVESILWGNIPDRPFWSDPKINMNGINRIITNMYVMAGMIPIVSGMSGFPGLDRSLPPRPRFRNAVLTAGISEVVIWYPRMANPMAACMGWNDSLVKMSARDTADTARDSME
ncbi:hypothetical protein OGATHE_006122 [Ogataea polymorpha]|uniref:Uncharacterized protein n=1 Tax=Ogataea polymorpha TaxID=460523 RepID=A0A9P8SXT0_9ASCO|nr:hypothetical protein OGATHE_006122 [Ogataea polymorpha]